MKKTYFLSLLLFSAILVLAMFMVGCVACFFDIGSLVMVLLSSFIMCLAGSSPSEMGRYFGAAFTGKSADRKTIESGIIFFKALGKYFILSGIIGMMMGLIGMLAFLDDPTKIGRSMALALISLLYAFFFIMIICVPFTAGLKKTPGRNRLSLTN